MDLVLDHPLTLDDWVAQNAKQGQLDRPLTLLFSDTVHEDQETMTDQGFFVTFLKPEESKSGKLLVALCRMTTVYVRYPNGDPGKLLHSETVVLDTFE